MNTSVEQANETRLTKLKIARHQLGTGLDLFIRDRDAISVHCLACGGAELIEGIATNAGLPPLSNHILKTHPNLDIRGLREMQRRYWNAFKHLSSRDGAVRDDTEILSAFDDTKNDAILFVAWWDYLLVTKKLPVAAQVFQVWWYALNERKLLPDADYEGIRKVFPAITKVDRAEQKRRLRRTVEKYRRDQELLRHPNTDDQPLCLSSTIDGMQL